MILSLVGALLVTGASGWAGHLLERRLRQRADELRQLASCLGVLTTQVEYGAVPLPRALERASQAGRAAVRLLFERAAQELASGGGQSAGEAWHSALGVAAQHSAWTLADLEMLGELAHVLGRSHREDQLRHLRVLQERLLAAHAEAAEEAGVRGRMWRNLGWLVGLAASLILL